MNIGEIRAKYPQYSDLSDGHLADALHSKNYADMPKDEFYSKIGFDMPEQQEPTQEVGGAKEAFGMGLAGAVPYGQRITSGLGAVMASPFTDQPIGDLYEQAQQYGQATQEAHPVASGVGTVAGIGATLPLASAKVLAGALPTQGARGALNVIPKGLAAVGDFARGGKVAKDASLAAKTGSLALRSAKGGAVAAPVAGVYAAGESEDQAEGFKRGARMGAGIGGALPVAGAALAPVGKGVKSIYKGFKARDVEQLEQAAGAIKSRATRAYTSMRESGATFTPESTNKIVNQLDSDLLGDGKLNPRLHDKVIGLMSDMRKDVDDGASLESLDQWRQLFGEVAGNSIDKINARKASLVMRSLDDAIRGADEGDLIGSGKEAINSLNLGRSEWARQSKFNAIIDIVRKSEGDANYLKRELKKFANNPKKTRGFSPKEVIALQDAARLGTGEGILKMFGKFGFDLGGSRIGSGVGAIVGSGGAGAAFGVLGAILAPTLGTASRIAQKKIARSKVEDLLNIIESGGEVTKNQIMKLPPKDAKKLLKRRN